MRVPTGSICGLISTAALRSKRMIEPSGRLMSFEMRTTTAFITSPFLTLTTSPCSMRLRISSLRLGLCRASAFLCCNRLDARDVAAHLPHARRVLQLPGRALETQVEAFLLQLEELVIELVEGHGAQIVGLHRAFLFRNPLDEAGLDRQLGRSQRKRFARKRLVHP